MRPRSVTVACVLLVLVYAVFASPASAGVPEPQGYWMGPMHSEVPATLAGAGVIHAQDLTLLLDQGTAVLIDAAAAPRRPDNLAPGAIWKPVPHQDIAGSVWLPEMGSGTLTLGEETFYRERLLALSAYSLDRPIVFYCHPQCWGSWNAAKRALSFGFRQVFWYPDGVEGWQDAGHPLVAVEPERPPQAGH